MFFLCLTQIQQGQVFGGYRHWKTTRLGVPGVFHLKALFQALGFVGFLFVCFFGGSLLWLSKLLPLFLMACAGCATSSSTWTPQPAEELGKPRPIRGSPFKASSIQYVSWPSEVATRVQPA